MGLRVKLLYQETSNQWAAVGIVTVMAYGCLPAKIQQQGSVQNCKQHCLPKWQWLPSMVA